jgi:hypothetical protein
MDNERFKTLEIPGEGAGHLEARTENDATTFNPETLLIQYIEARNAERRAKAIKDDITQQLLDHYDETGEVVSNGDIEMKIKSRTTDTYDVDEMRETNPELYNKCLGFDPKVATALVTAKIVSRSDLDKFKTSKTARWIDIVKGDK